MATSGHFVIGYSADLLFIAFASCRIWSKRATIRAANVENHNQILNLLAAAAAERATRFPFQLQFMLSRSAQRDQMSST